MIIRALAHVVRFLEGTVTSCLVPKKINVRQSTSVSFRIQTSRFQQSCTREHHGAEPQDISSGNVPRTMDLSIVRCLLKKLYTAYSTSTQMMGHTGHVTLPPEHVGASTQKRARYPYVPVFAFGENW
jgi:hypothetical protein